MFVERLIQHGFEASVLDINSLQKKDQHTELQISVAWSQAASTLERSGLWNAPGSDALQCYQLQLRVLP